MSVQYKQVSHSHTSLLWAYAGVGLTANIASWHPNHTKLSFYPQLSVKSISNQLCHQKANTEPDNNLRLTTHCYFQQMQSMMPGQTAPKDTARSAASVYARGCFAGSRLVSCTARSHGRTSAASAPVHAEGKYASAGVLSAGRVSGVPCSVQCSAVSDSVTNAFSDSLAPELPASAIREPSNGRVKISVLSSKQQAGSSAAVAEPELVASQLSVPFPVIQSYPKWGNLRIYDVSSYVNMQELAAACERLKVG